MFVFVNEVRLELLRGELQREASFVVGGGVAVAADVVLRMLVSIVLLSYLLAHEVHLCPRAKC